MVSADLFVVLMYHGLDSVHQPSELSNKGDLIYVVDTENFISQMNYLNNKALPVTTSPFQTEFKSKISIGLTFDDGHISNYTKALPILKSFGYKAYFFITTDWIGKKNYMTSSMVKELHSIDMVIGSHGKTHKYLSDLKEREIEHELRCSKEKLESIVNDQVTSFSAPGGRLDNRVRKIAKKIGYSQIFGSEPIVNKHRADLIENFERFAITRSFPFSDYIKIVNGCPPIHSYLKHFALKQAKHIIGNRNYEHIRDKIIKNF